MDAVCFLHGWRRCSVLFVWVDIRATHDCCTNPHYYRKTTVVHPYGFAINFPRGPVQKDLTEILYNMNTDPDTRSHLRCLKHRAANRRLMYRTSSGAKLNEAKRCVFFGVKLLQSTCLSYKLFLFIRTFVRWSSNTVVTRVTWKNS